MVSSCSCGGTYRRFGTPSLGVSAKADRLVRLVRLLVHGSRSGSVSALISRQRRLTRLSSAAHASALSAWFMLLTPSRRRDVRAVKG
mgnify:CR=1 FL=1